MMLCSVITGKLAHCGAYLEMMLKKPEGQQGEMNYCNTLGSSKKKNPKLQTPTLIRYAN